MDNNDTALLQQYRDALKEAGLPENCPVAAFVQHHRSNAALATALDSVGIIRNLEDGLTEAKASLALAKQLLARARANGLRPNDSFLEYILRMESGIHVVLRQKLIQAYESDDGAVEVPRLIDEHSDLIDESLLPTLRALAADRSQ